MRDTLQELLRHHKTNSGPARSPPLPPWRACGAVMLPSIPQLEPDGADVVALAGLRHDLPGDPWRSVMNWKRWAAATVTVFAIPATAQTRSPAQSGGANSEAAREAERDAVLLSRPGCRAGSRPVESRGDRTGAAIEGGGQRDRRMGVHGGARHEHGGRAAGDGRVLAQQLQDRLSQL